MGVWRSYPSLGSKGLMYKSSQVLLQKFYECSYLCLCIIISAGTNIRGLWISESIPFYKVSGIIKIP